MHLQCLLLTMYVILGDTEFSRSFSNEASYAVVADYKPPPQVTAMATVVAA